jgi:putative transposase
LRAAHGWSDAELDYPVFGFKPPTSVGQGFSLGLAMGYNAGSHTLFHHRYHIVCVPKYRYKVLHGEVRARVRDIIRQVCAEMGVTIVSGALSRDHVHLFVEIPPHVSVSNFVRLAKGRSSYKVQREFEHVRKRYWGQRFWARGYFSTTSGNITDDVIMTYLERHTVPHQKASASRPEPTGFGR